MTTHQLVEKIKKKSLHLAHKANASHIGGAFSVADVLAVLYGKVLQYNIKDYNDPDRDRLFYSKGHACTTLYAVLQAVGFFTEEMLDSFSENGSYFTTHVNHKIPGIELSTGSLGHAMSVACGVAYAGKIRNETWKTYCIVSDGELDEGSNWEAILFAAHHQLKNFTLIVDYNKIQSFGNTNEIINLEPITNKFEAFNFNTISINGHNHDDIYAALKKENTNAKPKVIIANTVKGNGVDFMEHKLMWHYKSPNAEQLSNALKQIEN